MFACSPCRSRSVTRFRQAVASPYRRCVAKVDLTLIVNGQAGLTPTVSSIDLRPNAVMPGVGNIAPNFIFGASAGATATAARTDSLGFSLSMVGLRDKRQEQRCCSRPASTSTVAHGAPALSE